jgi:hypothetical protein
MSESSVLLLPLRELLGKLAHHGMGRDELGRPLTRILTFGTRSFPSAPGGTRGRLRRWECVDKCSDVGEPEGKGDERDSERRERDSEYLEYSRSTSELRQDCGAVQPG